MHSDLKAQQRILNQFVKEYNHIPPHDAYGMETLALTHCFFTRPFKVTNNGAIRWKSYYWVYLTAALKDKYVGIEELGNGIWKEFY